MISVTGFAYESLNVLHRWSARLVVLLSIIHVGGRVSAVQPTGLAIAHLSVPDASRDQIYVNNPTVNPTLYGHKYIIWGSLAFAAMILMAIGAARPIRNRFYSAFIISHVIFLILIIIGLWVHRPQQMPWLWASLALYLLDRIWRTARIIWFHGVHPVVPASDQTLAWVEPLSQDTMKVCVRTHMSEFCPFVPQFAPVSETLFTRFSQPTAWIPGQHGYLHAPRSTLQFWISHVANPPHFGSKSSC